MTPIIKTQNLTFFYPETDGSRPLTNRPRNRPGSFVVFWATTLRQIHWPSNSTRCSSPAGARSMSSVWTLQEDLVIQIRRTVVWFQNPDNQIVANVVEDDVAFAPKTWGCRGRNPAPVDEALNRWACPSLLFTPPSPVRRQKQRVAIAGVIAMQPDCIVLDEPTAMLDPRAVERSSKPSKPLPGEGHYGSFNNPPYGRGH